MNATMHPAPANTLERLIQKSILPVDKLELKKSVILSTKPFFILTFSYFDITVRAHAFD